MVSSVGHTDTPGPLLPSRSHGTSSVNWGRQLAEGQQKTVCIADDRALRIASWGCSNGRLNKAKRSFNGCLGNRLTIGIFFLHIMSVCHPYVGLVTRMYGAAMMTSALRCASDLSARAWQPRPLTFNGLTVLTVVRWVSLWCLFLHKIACISQAHG